MDLVTSKPNLTYNSRGLSPSYFYSFYLVLLLVLAIVIQFTAPVESATVLRISMPHNGNAPSEKMDFGMASTSGLCLQLQKRTRHQRHSRGRWGQHGLLRARLSSLQNFQSSCSCGRILCPICGSDGVTYSNLCEFHCANDTKKDLSISHSGRCSSIRRRKNKNNAEASTAQA